MNRSSELQFEGIYLPLSTPFLRSGKTDIDSLSSNIEIYRDFGISGFLVAGSTGEAAHLDNREKLDILDCVIESAGSLPVLLGINFSTLKFSRDFFQLLEDRDLKALLVSVPSYYKNRMNDEVLEVFFRKLADSSPHALLLYNFPKFTGIELSPGLVARLAQRPNICGMKDSSGNLVYMQKVLKATDRWNFDVLSGNAETFGLARILGVKGGILAIGCAFPGLTVKLSQTEISNQVRYRLLLEKVQSLSSLIVGEMGVPGIKYAMDLMGMKGKYCRSPLIPLSRSEKIKIEKTIKQVLDNE